MSSGSTASLSGQQRQPHREAAEGQQGVEPVGAPPAHRARAHGVTAHCHHCRHRVSLALAGGPGVPLQGDIAPRHEDVQDPPRGRFGAGGRYLALPR